jgi:hypothetical protein
MKKRAADELLDAQPGIVRYVALRGSLAELRILLESKTPASAPPAAWINTAAWWSAVPLESTCS